MKVKKLNKMGSFRTFLFVLLKVFNNAKGWVIFGIFHATTI